MRGAERARFALASALAALGACVSPPPRTASHEPAAPRTIEGHEPAAALRAEVERPVSFAELCVTSGRVRRPTDDTNALALVAPSPARSSPTFSVDAGGMRAVVAGGAGRRAELAFAYGGPSSSRAPLANGELRRQVGLKLRASDTCNVVYVMWRIEPASGVFVSVKRNPGMTAHEGCGPRGYLHVRPTRSRPPPPVARGARHVLRAELAGTSLRVTTDGAVAWEGALPPEALELDGPAGVRSDNVAFDFDLRVPAPASGFGPCDRVL